LEGAIMLDGLQHVWRAAEVLAGADTGLRERLKLARSEFSVALRRAEQWPPELLSVARSLDRIIRLDGKEDPLDSLNGAMARQVAEDLVSLAADVAAAFHQAGSGEWGSKTPRREQVAPLSLALLGNQK
jgi:hypothetical protein